MTGANRDQHPNILGFQTIPSDASGGTHHPRRLSTTTGTKHGMSSSGIARTPSRAARCQTCNFGPETPCLRATSATELPSRQLSSPSLAFTCSGQRQHPLGPVATTQFRAVASDRTLHTWMGTSRTIRASNLQGKKRGADNHPGIRFISPTNQCSPSQSSRVTDRGSILCPRTLIALHPIARCT